MPKSAKSLSARGGEAIENDIIKQEAAINLRNAARKQIKKKSKEIKHLEQALKLARRHRHETQCLTPQPNLESLDVFIKTLTMKSLDAVKEMRSLELQVAQTIKTDVVWEPKWAHVPLMKEATWFALDVNQYSDHREIMKTSS